MAQASNTARTLDAEEVARFARLSGQWWDERGPFQPLHRINPLRLTYIRDQLCRRFRRDAKGPSSLAGFSVLDIGCGGGLLCEGMAERGAHVVGIDRAAENIAAARHHAVQRGLAIDYQCVDVERLAVDAPGGFDIVTCLEVLEHVPEPRRIVAACAAALRPGGAAFFSTINRNPKSFAFAIIGAEYLFGWLPRGTHEYLKRIRPAELADACRHAALDVRELTGLHFNPVLRTYWLGGNVDVNYFAYARKAVPA